MERFTSFRPRLRHYSHLYGLTRPRDRRNVRDGKEPPLAVCFFYAPHTVTARSSRTKSIRAQPMQRNIVSPRRRCGWLWATSVTQPTKPVARKLVDWPESE